jgi:hypothetical protein
MDAPGPRRRAGLSRRTAIIGGSAAAVTLGRAGAAEPRWQTPVGIPADQYQATADALVARGYRLVHLDAYAVGDAPQFATIWDQGPGPAWTQRRDLAAADLQAALAEASAQGRRLRRLCGYERGGQAFHAALWTEGAGPDQQVRFGLTMDQYHRAFGQLTNDDYRLVWVRGYAVADVPYFAAIFEKDFGPDFIARHGLDAAGYQAAMAEAMARTYRLRHVCGYVVGGAPNFAAIWEYGQGPAWQARYNLPLDQFTRACAEMEAEGYRLFDVSGYGLGAAAYYAAIWIND